VDSSESGIIRIGYADAAEIDAVIANLRFRVNTQEDKETALTLTTLEDCDSVSVAEETAALTLPGHTYESVVTPPAAGEQGYTTHTCVDCGYSFVGDFVGIVASGWSGYTTWTLADNGVLTISPTDQSFGGETNMKNYWKVHGVLTLPWSAYAGQIVTVVVEDGVNDLGQMAFYELPNLTTVILGADVGEIRAYAFKNCRSLTTINLEGVSCIREGAFLGCTALTEVNLREDAVVEDWAFTRSGVTFD